MRAAGTVGGRGSLALLGALLAQTATAQAYNRIESNWNPASLPIGYRINLASAPASIGSEGARTAVEAGFASWSAPACTRWRTTNAGTSTLTRARSGDSERTILWISDTWPAELGDVRSTIGVTTPVWRSGGYFLDADIQFNAVGFQWNMTGTRGVDTQSIATHEQGHFLGLNHSTLSRAVMYASYSGGVKRTLEADDINGVCAIYPSGMPGPDAGTPPDGGSSGSGALGDPCSATQACASGNQCVCRSASDCFCSRACSGSSPCPSGFTCTTTSLGALCLPGGGNSMMGTRRTGEPCNGGTDCASGICVNTGRATICTQVCTDDCSCPDSYSCFPTSSPGTSVCGPGTNECVPDDAGIMEIDAAPEMPPADASPDAQDPSLQDAGMDASGQGPGNAPGCGCAVPGGAPRAPTLGVLAVLAGLFWRRRRPR